MRNLRKNQRTLFYASYLSAEPIKDEYGNDTLEVKHVYEEPKMFSCNYSSNVGEVGVEAFGNISNYSRVISFSGTVCPLKEKAKVWINRDITENANYEVIKVADSLNSFLIALGEIV